MNPQSPEHKIDLSEYYHLILKHKWLIALCMVIGITIAFWHNYRTLPVFQTTVTMMMNNNQRRSPLTGETLVYENIISQTLAFNTHSKLITSRPVLERVIRDLKLDQIDPLKKLEPGLLRQVMENFNRLIGRNDPETQPKRPDLNSLVAILGEKIHSEEVRDTLLMRISVVDHDPIMAMNIANTTARAYIQYDISSRLKSSQNSVTWMSDQLYDMKKKLDDAEQEFLAYKEKEKLFSLEGRQGQISKKIDEFNSAYIQTKNKRIELDIRLRELQRTSGPDGKIQNVHGLVNSPIITDLYRQLMDAEVELSKLSNVYKSKHPKMVQIATQIDKTNKKLKEELKKEIGNLSAERTILEVREASFQNAVSGFEEDALSTNKKELKYSILERNVETYRQMYDTLLSKLKQSNMADNSEISELRIAEEAVAPGGPIRPRKQRNLTFGAVLGLISGLGLTYLWNYFDRSIRTEEDVQKYFGLPVLSVIPLAEKAGYTGPDKRTPGNT
jgi:uncharacterized protein involved in exopolysaccharide biosynthesis